MANPTPPVAAGLVLRAPAARPPPPTWSDPPPGVIDRILQHVPLHARLTVCALVSKGWAAAAARATQRVQLAVKPDGDAAAGQLSCVQSWLDGSEHLTDHQITYLHFHPVGYKTCADNPDMASMGTIQLPCSKLRGLQVLILAGLDVHLQQGAPPAQVPAALRHPLPALQHLQLAQCTLDTAADLERLALFNGSTALISLRLYDVRINNHPQDIAGTTINQGLVSLLGRLPELRTLCLVVDQAVESDLLNSITRLHHLQHLDMIFWTGDRSDIWPSSLPPGLNVLRVYIDNITGPADELGVQPVAATSEWFGSLRNTPQLRELGVSSSEFDPLLLSSITGLNTLHLNYCRLLPGGQDGTQALLQSLTGLTQLQYFECTLQPYSVDVAEEGLAPQLFAALTASKCLTCLKFGTYYEQPLAWGAAQHIFPAGSSMPQLQQLSFGNWFDEPAEVYADGPDDWCLDDADLCRMARACPRLQELLLQRVVQPDATLSFLELLPPSLTSLAVWTPAFGDAAAAAVARLTQLRFLEWDCAPHLTDLGFQHLTALSALTGLRGNYFYCQGLSLSDDLFSGTVDPNNKALDLSASNEQGPIWQQLQAMCLNSPACLAEQERRRQQAALEELYRARLNAAFQQLDLGEGANPAAGPLLEAAAAAAAAANPLEQGSEVDFHSLGNSESEQDYHSAESTDSE